MSIALQRSVPINKFKLKEDEFFKGRCAEVYITNQNGFVLNCLLCDAKFRDYILLKKHASAIHNFDIFNSCDDEMVKNEIVIENHPVHEIQIEATEFDTQYCGVEDTYYDNNYSIKEKSPPEETCPNEVWTIIPYKEANDAGSTQNLDIMNIVTLNKSGGSDEIIATELNEDEEFYLSNDAHKQGTTKTKIPEKQVVNVEELVTTSEEEEEKEKKPKAVAVKNVKKMERRTLSIGRLPKARPNNSNSERIHICPICSFAFTDRSNLKAHINRHSGEKKYECAECGKRFFTRTECHTHYRTHTGERPYICSSCGKACLTASELKVHERRHTNDRRYQCTYCEKRFFDGKHLKDHIVSHTQERKFVCEICNSRFLRRKSLKSHIKIHENKREYVCNICGNAYNQKPALSIHIRSKHGVHLHKADGEMNKNQE